MPFAPAPSGIYYTEFIAELCSRREVETYFEIGVATGANLKAIDVPNAIGVDPSFNLTVDVTTNKRSVQLYRMSSDKFFHSNKIGQGDIDLAFLDGMHVFEYLLRDFYNTEANCSRDALILMHDCLPFTEEMITRQDHGGAWTGDVWKIIPILQKYRPDLNVSLLNCAPTGLVVVSRLDPESTVLRDAYEDIVAEFKSLPNDAMSISRMYEKEAVLCSSDILKDFNHTMYFRL